MPNAGGTAVNKRARESAVLCAVAIILCAGCAPGLVETMGVAGDMRPPALLSAGPRSPSVFALSFDEEVLPVQGSYYLEPGPIRAEATVSGAGMEISFPSQLAAGASYRVAGEAQDRAGNVTRFLFTFSGWNPEPARLALNEVQAGKNSSTLNPHRDYVEFAVKAAGDLGGVTVEWASASKEYEYRFPAARVTGGSIIVLHCAPEGIPEEKDEAGADTAISGGVDSSASGRDFWCPDGGLPDSSGIILVRPRPGEEPMDGLFYSESDKTGPVETERISSRLAELSDAGLWETGATQWSDAFAWKPSGSRPFHRVTAGVRGKAAWTVGESGTQSPGGIEPAPLASRSSGTSGKRKKPRLRRDP